MTTTINIKDGKLQVPDELMELLISLREKRLEHGRNQGTFHENLEQYLKYTFND